MLLRKQQTKRQAQSKLIRMTAAAAKQVTNLDYGIDAPGVIRNLAVIGAACLLASAFVPSITVGSVIFVSRPMFLTVGVLCAVEAVLMYLYAKYGKFGHRDRMLNMVRWRGDERVLDVGTGRGLLAIGAAKRAARGQVTGIDIWSAKDLSSNSIGRTRANIDAEGVSANCEALDGDARKLIYTDGTFDVVVSNLCLHNIPSRTGREAACREIYRVLKPGGTAVISDFWRMREYMSVFRTINAPFTVTSLDVLRTFPPLRILKVSKPSPA